MVHQQQGVTKEAVASTSHYAGGEIGSQIGRSVGGPFVGSIVGGVIGSQVASQYVSRNGRLESVSNRITSAVGGEQNAAKLSHVVMTSLGYGPNEVCLCCPCMTKSQILCPTYLLLFIFQFFRLSFAIHYNNEIGDTSDIERDYDQRVFRYMLIGSIVWILFLPIYICTLCGIIYRQCCCCLCDPCVCFSALCDAGHRCLCQCRGFNFMTFAFNLYMVFHIVLASYGLYALFNADLPDVIFDIAIAAIALDFILAGSELVHHFNIAWKFRRPSQSSGQNVDDTLPSAPQQDAVMNQLHFPPVQSQETNVPLRPYVVYVSKPA